jgi:hypothetical protein
MAARVSLLATDCETGDGKLETMNKGPDAVWRALENRGQMLEPDL